MLRGFSIEGYRSYGVTQVFDDLSPLNFLAGQNNSGKTNTLSFLADVLTKPGRYTPQEIDKPQGIDFSRATAWSLKFKLEDLFDLLPQTLDIQAQQALEQLLINDRFDGTPGERTFWLRVELAGDGLPSFPQADDLARVVGAPESFSIEVVRGLGHTNIVHNAGENLRIILRQADILNFLHSVRSIPSIRRVREAEHDSGSQLLDGTGMQKILGELQHPKWTDRNKKQQFHQINRTLQHIFEDESVEFEVVDHANELLLTTHGLPFPLEWQGLGVQQVAILVCAVLQSPPTLFLVEEPEVNLHPTLQRKLARFLSDHDEHQYIIATHSAHMLDTPRSSVFHLTMTAMGTVVTGASTPRAAYAICEDLGYRATDILQSNCIIWVEGPSDRIYIKHLLKSLCEANWIEGVHYSVMIYGGALLSNFATEDGSPEDFICLPKINRNMVVVMDSDRTDPISQALTPGKIRVLDEFAERGCPELAWVTEGYTFENYVPKELLETSVRQVHKKLEFEWNGSMNSNPFAGVRVDKIAVARRVCAGWSIADVSGDLAAKIRTIEQFIGSCNR